MTQPPQPPQGPEPSGEPLPGAQWSSDPQDLDKTQISSPRNPYPQAPVPPPAPGTAGFASDPQQVMPAVQYDPAAQYDPAVQYAPTPQYDPAGHYDQTMVGQPSFGMPGAEQAGPQQQYDAPQYGSQQPYGQQPYPAPMPGTTPFGSEQPYGHAGPDSQGFPSYQQAPQTGPAPYGAYDRPVHRTEPFEPLPAKRKKGRKIALIALGVVVLLAIIAGVLWFLNRGESDEDAIKRVSSEFSEAVASQDTAKMTELMCKAEAQRIGGDTAPTSGEGDNNAAEPEKFDVSATKISGDNAKATLTFPSDGRTSTLYFAKEDDNWVVCDSAAASFGP